MKKLDVTSLLPGNIAQKNYYSEKGDLLISKGVAITSNHLSMLLRRNIFSIYVELGSEEEEVERILAADIKTMDKLDIDESTPAPPPTLPKHAPQPKKAAARALSLPGLRDIKAGKDGLSQLLESDLSISLDSRFTRRTSDRPTGQAFLQRVTQVSAEERTVQQRTDVSKSYDNALEDVTRILNYLADGNQISGLEVLDIVKRFLRIFITDHNILLNISGKKHTGTNYLFNHSLNVCLLSINIAASEGYSEAQILEIGAGALLHDLGMLLISQDILAKPGRLDEEEWYEVQKHPMLALNLLERIRQLPESVPFVAYQAHERENRSGYPKQRASHLIHNFAKIVQIADIYESMSSPRTYREAFIPYKAMENVIKMTRQGLLSGGYVEAFLRYASLFPVGSLVELNDRRVAKVISANAKAFAKPVVSVLTDASGAMLPGEKISRLSLAKNTDSYISRALPSDYLKGLDLMDGF